MNFMTSRMPSVRERRSVESLAANDLRFTLHAQGMDKYPAKAHARRVAEKLGVENGMIGLAATKNVNWPNSDMPAPFRQDRYFYYLTGCNEPDCYLTYNIENDHLILWLPPVDQDPRHVVFYGNGSTVEEAMEKYDIDEARYIQKPKPYPDLSAQERYMLEHFEDFDTGLVTSILEATRMWSARAGVRDSVMLRRTPVFLENVYFAYGSSEGPKMSLRTAMHACRVIKDEHEIRLIRKANDITAAAHVNALKGMHAFDNEAEIEAAYMQVCIARRAKEQAYDPIVGSGANAAILHYSENLANFGSGQTVVIDAGCEVERYASDVTRTIPVNKNNPGYWPSKEAKAIYDLVERIQESCIKQMKPGQKYIETTWHAHMMVIEGLVELGIIKGGFDPEELFLNGISRYFLPHGLGHHVGLEVHDVSPDPPPPAQHCETWTAEDVDRLREAYTQWSPTSAPKGAHLMKPEDFGISSACHMSVDGPNAPILEPGMIVTIEPGIYFSKFLMKALLSNAALSPLINKDVLERYIPVGGVRIEDDILITENGYENLTTAPKGEAMLRIIRDSAGNVPFTSAGDRAA